MAKDSEFIYKHLTCIECGREQQTHCHESIYTEEYITNYTCSWCHINQCKDYMHAHYDIMTYLTAYVTAKNFQELSIKIRDRFNDDVIKFGLGPYYFKIIVSCNIGKPGEKIKVIRYKPSWEFKEGETGLTEIDVETHEYDTVLETLQHLDRKIESLEDEFLLGDIEKPRFIITKNKTRR